MYVYIYVYVCMHTYICTHIPHRWRAVTQIMGGLNPITHSAVYSNSHMTVGLKWAGPRCTPYLCTFTDEQELKHINNITIMIPLML